MPARLQQPNMASAAGANGRDLSHLSFARKGQFLHKLYSASLQLLWHCKRLNDVKSHFFGQGFLIRISTNHVHCKVQGGERGPRGASDLGCADASKVEDG